METERLVPELGLSKLKQRPHYWHRLQSPQSSTPPPKWLPSRRCGYACIFGWQVLGWGWGFFVGIRSQQRGMLYSHNATLLAKSQGVVVSSTVQIRHDKHWQQSSHKLHTWLSHPGVCFTFLSSVSGQVRTFFLFHFRNSYLFAFKTGQTKTCPVLYKASNKLWWTHRENVLQKRWWEL